MKLLKIISKNFKMLFRAKGSGAIVLFGPLIIILLVGFALNKPSTYELSIGVYATNYNELANSFIGELKNNNYLIQQFDSKEGCIDAIKKSIIHTCIVFPEDFEIAESKTNELKFYVDYSRTNLVYQIIETVSSQIDIRSSELSFEMTNKLLNILTNTNEEVDADILALINLKSATNNIVSEIISIQENMDSIDLKMEETNIKSIKSKFSNIEPLVEDLKDSGEDAISEGREFSEDQGNSSNAGFLGDLDDIEQAINTTFNETSETIKDIEILISNASNKINDIKTKLEKAQKANKNIKSSLENTKDSLDILKEDTNKVKASLESINSGIESIEVKSAESIVSPITTSIEPVIAESTQLNFMFPALLILVIMFIGIMLSSTLVIMEKKSKSSFRTFTTPTKDSLFVISTYITSLILLIVQIIIILILAYFFIKSDLLANFGLTSLILFISMSLFILIGMVIGYLSSTQEATTMLSIAVGSVFLLLSNLILPLETMSDFIRNLTKFNPYVISSEILKKVLVFNIGIKFVIKPLLFLTLGIFILFILIFLFQKISKISYLNKMPHIKRQGLIYIPEDNYLKLGKHIIKNKEEVLTLLKKIDDEEFSEYVSNNQNEIFIWLKNILKEKTLARKIKTKNREDMIKIIDTHLKKEKNKTEKKSKRK
ncbi:MAG: ABC transporter permease [Nanoarchaeota archaeon]|nr:ABC transporter permease [Nanoarchaeota archaeon]